MTEDGSLLPKSAGEDHKLTGPLGLTEGVMYGTTLPTEAFDGQLFFLEDDSYDIPLGGNAEYRNQKEILEPGYCVTSADNGQVYKTTEKFQACDGIVSDTFGFAICKTDEC